MTLRQRILTLLASNPAGLTARDLAALLAGVDESEANLSLYASLDAFTQGDG